MRPEISLFKDMRPNVAKRRNAVRSEVIGPAVTVEENIGDLVLTKEIVEENGPFGEAAPEIHGPLGPVEPIAAAKIDAMDDKSLMRHFHAKLPEQRPGGPCKKTKVRRPLPVIASLAGSRAPFSTGPEAGASGLRRRHVSRLRRRQYGGPALQGGTGAR